MSGTSLREASPAQTVFDRDLARFSDYFETVDAIRTDPADGFQWIEESRVTQAVLSAYRLLIAYGYANGLIGQAFGTEPTAIPAGGGAAAAGPHTCGA